MNTILALIVIQIIINLVLLVWVKYKIRNYLGSASETERVRREMAALVMELDASADRNISILEDRMAALKEMLGQADKRIAALDKELSNRKKEAAVYDSLGRFSGARIPPASQPEPEKESAIPFIRFSEKPLPIEESFADKVLSLFKRGFSSDIIAARLDATMAEVDLVISLDRERQSKPLG